MVRRMNKFNPTIHQIPSKSYSETIRRDNGQSIIYFDELQQWIDQTFGNVCFRKEAYLYTYFYSQKSGLNLEVKLFFNKKGYYEKYEVVPQRFHKDFKQYV